MLSFIDAGAAPLPGAIALSARPELSLDWLVGRMPTRVAIVVTGDGSADVARLVRSQNVWIADTPSNRAAAQAVWSTNKGDERYEVTTFKVDPREEPDESVAMILPVIDEHHGLRAEWVDRVALDVYGARATPRVRAALEKLGSFEIAEWPGGFSANRNRAV